YLVIESTYGNRVHLRTDPLVLLGNVIRETAGRGGVVVIPAFAVGRAQEIMFYIHQLKESGAIPKQLPVYLNSPMARDATDIYQRHHAEHRLSAAQCDAVCRGVRIVNSVEESKELNRKQTPMVIIAASGMATGGRVLYHLEAFGSDSRNTILFAGYQAGGTRGAALVGGAGVVKIHGVYVPILAQVAQIENLSAHADSDELIAWLSNFTSPPKKVFIVHGEPDASDALRKRIEAMPGWTCHIPDYRDSVALD
ncbi:MAG: MBL fold metallo-hydrolase RNA specificity domain-containing protein, partial [Telluria sp.]